MIEKLEAVLLWRWVSYASSSSPLDKKKKKEKKRRHLHEFLIISLLKKVIGGELSTPGDRTCDFGEGEFWREEVTLFLSLSFSLSI